MARLGYGTDITTGVTEATGTVVTIAHGDITDGTIGAGVALVTDMDGADMDGAVMATGMDGADITIFGAHQVITDTVGMEAMATTAMPTIVVEECITITPQLPITTIVRHYAVDLTGLQAAVILPGIEVLQLHEVILLQEVVEMESLIEEL